MALGVKKRIKMKTEGRGMLGEAASNEFLSNMSSVNAIGLDELFFMRIQSDWMSV